MKATTALNTHRFDMRHNDVILNARRSARRFGHDMVILPNAIPCMDCKQSVRNPDSECTARLLAKFRAA